MSRLAPQQLSRVATGVKDSRRPELLLGRPAREVVGLALRRHLHLHVGLQLGELLQRHFGTLIGVVPGGVVDG
jgi:hypothetical protein